MNGRRSSDDVATAQRVEGTIYTIEVLNPETKARETRRVDVEEYFARSRGKTIRFKS